ncbi:hypothetical protein [Aureispira sp. CCB-QB1]|uniref:phosphoribosyltransferase-like protein n=1 Tax=Aureispira sp. CCB-QB1 TaxID=1313421 RepID=UPI000695BF43|nr:hypothetical protein [Aureispira sp. CCB-QB1]
MDNLINDIYDIIKDYRNDDGIKISTDYIKDWINQFEEPDRLFLAEQLKEILRKRYISKQFAKEFHKRNFIESIVKEVNKKKAKKNHIKDPIECLKKCRFISHQPQEKSQSELLEFINEILKTELNITIDQCGIDSPEYFIYVDDILCTGDTIFQGLVGSSKKGWLYEPYNKTMSNIDYIKSNNVKIIMVLFAYHQLNIRKLFSRIQYTTSERFNYVWWYVSGGNIDNLYKTLTSKFEFLYPLEEIKDPEIEACEQHIIEKVDEYCTDNNYDIRENYFYRPINCPKEETFFSSPDVRKRFEKIILKKSIEIYNSANNDNVRMRPLGYGLKTDKSFGYGTLLFTWRNVPFNTPLVFWYEHHNWQPLFKRKYTTYRKPLSLIDIINLSKVKIDEKS